MEPDTEGTFRPERIAEIAARFGGMFFNVSILNEVINKSIVDPEQACENISFARCMNSEVSTYHTLQDLP
jgi:hypothetical protein